MSNNKETFTITAALPYANGPIPVSYTHLRAHET